MNLSKYKEWRELLQRAIVKQQSKREHTYPVCLYTMEKYKKLESVNTQNDYETNKKWRDKKKSLVFLCVINVFKFKENKFKIAQKDS